MMINIKYQAYRHELVTSYEKNILGQIEIHANFKPM